MDRCKHLEIGADATDKAWGKANADKKLVKFGRW